jgi:hypothetical protein
MKSNMDAENSTHANQTLVKTKDSNPNVLIFHLQQEITKQDEDAIALTDGEDLIARPLQERTCQPTAPPSRPLLMRLCLLNQQKFLQVLQVSQCLLKFLQINQHRLL